MTLSLRKYPLHYITLHYITLHYITLHYGVRGIAHDWFESYLTNRQQYVTLNKANSKRARITCGVPQGSILGPILFLLYINDLNDVSNRLQSIMFADDTGSPPYINDPGRSRLMVGRDGW